MPTFTDRPRHRDVDDDTAAPMRYPQEVFEEFAKLAEECSICYQCGTCTS